MDQPQISTEKSSFQKPKQKIHVNCSYTLKSIQNWTVTCPTSQTHYYQFSSQQGPAIRIYFMTHSIIRIRVTFQKQNKFVQQSYALVMTAWEDRFDQIFKYQRVRVKNVENVNFQQKESKDGKYYHFETTQLIGKIYQNPYGIQIYNKDGIILYKDLRGRSHKRDLQGRIYHYLQSNPETEYYYGFGQSTGPLNKSFLKIKLAPHDSLAYNALNTPTMYKHIPFYIKINKNDKHAIGLFYNNTYECTFDMGGQRSGYWPRYSYYCADGGDIDIFVINGPSIMKVIQKYTDLTGKSAMPGRDCLGYIGSTMYYAQLQNKCDDAIINFVQKCARQHVPISNFHLSSGYTLNTDNKNAPKRYVLTWNKQKFVSPKNFFKKMLEYGVVVSPNIKPGILTTHPYYKQFSQKQMFIKDPTNINKPYIDRWWGGDGSFIDFTSSKTRQHWKNKLMQQIIHNGTYSIWNDNNEYESIDNRAAICKHEYETNNNYGTVDQLKVVQSLLMAKTAHQAVSQVFNNMRPHIITRSGSAGMQRYASSWSGDNYTNWQTLKYNISTVLNMGLSGIANYGCDIGGFWGPAPSQQLLLRWVQHGIFQPRFSIHSCNQDNTVTEPWMFPQISQKIAKTIRFRYMLLPYLYSLLFYAHKKGHPIVRPLVYEFQYSDFDGCCEEGENFMLGPYLLVSNVLQPLKQVNKQCENSNNFEFVDFPSINEYVANCVDLNYYDEILGKQQQLDGEKKQQTHIHALLSYNQSHNYHKIKTSSSQKGQYAFKKVYLPKGCNWYSWNGRNKYPGGTTLTVKVTQNSIPLFIKGRSIIPLAITFGNKYIFDVKQMNKQIISGLYVKIAFDCDNKGWQYAKKKVLQFLLYEDDGKSVIQNGGEKKTKKQEDDQQKICADASFLLTKFMINCSEFQGKPNPNLILLKVSRLGNLYSSKISTLIFQIKSTDKSPHWISINGIKCIQHLYQQQWAKTKHLLIDDKNKDTQGVYGWWFYDHERGAAILKVNQGMVKPQKSQQIEKYREFQIAICKDKMLSFSKEYAQIKKESQSK